MFYRVLLFWLSALGHLALVPGPAAFGWFIIDLLGGLLATAVGGAVPALIRRRAARFLLVAWLTAATLNALLTWWAVTLALNTTLLLGLTALLRLAVALPPLLPRLNASAMPPQAATAVTLTTTPIRAVGPTTGIKQASAPAIRPLPPPQTTASSSSRSQHRRRPNPAPRQPSPRPRPTRQETTHAR